MYVYTHRFTGLEPMHGQMVLFGALTYGITYGALTGHLREVLEISPASGSRLKQTWEGGREISRHSDGEGTIDEFLTIFA